MTQAVVQLQEIVTTATGEQRRVEIGNAVSTLGDVDQKVETTPITNMGDLLVAKAPGVVVLPGAMTGLGAGRSASAASTRCTTLGSATSRSTSSTASA